jgi:alkylhydroperoxidase family enzyme
LEAAYEKREDTMADIRQAREALITRILEGDGQAPHAQRRAAFDNTAHDEPLATLTGKVANRAHEVTDQDVAAVRASGLSEDQIFELAVCAAVGKAARQHDAALAALAALESATKE